MNRILIFGLDNSLNGVNTYITNFIENMNLKNYEIDLLVINGLNKMYAEKIKKNNCIKKIYYIDIFRKNIFKTLKTSYELFKKNQYDILYANISATEMFVYFLFAKKFSPNTKIILHSHNSNLDSIFFKICHYLFRPYILKNADEFLTCSEKAGNFMYGRKMMKSGKVKLINNSINFSKFYFNETNRKKIREKFEISDEFLIGHVGRFDKQKNHKFILKLFYLYKKINKKVKIILIGDGPRKGIIQKEIKKYKLERDIIIINGCDNVNEIYHAMDLFILPSLYEGLPIVGLEAQIAGLTCIFSDLISNKLKISNNCIFLPLEIDKWVKIIDDIYCKKEYENRNDNLLANAIGYSVKKNVQKVEQIIEENVIHG